MTSRDPAIANIKQASLSPLPLKQSVVFTWLGGATLYVDDFEIAQTDTDLSGTIASSTNIYTFPEHPILISISIPYVVDTSTSSYSGWEIKAVIYAYLADGDIADAIPVGNIEVGDRITTSTSSDTETIQSRGVLSGQFIVSISSPTTFYVSIVLQSYGEPVGADVGSISSFYDVATSSSNAVMTLTEVNTWTQI